jgi:hypothetical protein
MARATGYVFAREATVVNVGGRPAEYADITVTDRRTGNPVTIKDTDNEPVDPGDLGTPYAFKALQKVPKNHPAVEAAPGAFMTAEEAGDLVEA